MIDLDIILQALLKKKGLVAAMVLIPVAVALSLSLVWPKSYLAETSMLPGNAQLNDKSRFFSENIQDLVSTFGTADDLDRLYATARSGLTFNALVDSFNLIQHYGLNENKTSARNQAIRKLKANSYILKTEYAELKIGIWDRDPNMAAALANGFVYRIQQVNQELFSTYYSSSIQKLEAALAVEERAYQEALHGDSSGNYSGMESLGELRAEINRYKRIIGEYRVAMLTPPPSLVILEKAVPPTEADWPRPLKITLVTFLVALIVTVFVVTYINRK